MIYQFADFTYDLKQRQLFHGQQVLELTRKNHALLGHLLAHPKRLISRDELIDHVWDGRVVTNNTIDQCILKLRKTLNQAVPGEYIESVYGQGIRFLPTIHTAETVDGVAANQSGYPVFWVGLAAACLGLLIMWLIDRSGDELPATNPNPALDVISQSSIQASRQTNQWLVTGLRGYLVYQLNQQAAITVNSVDLQADNPQRHDLLFTVQTADPQALQLALQVQAPAANPDQAAQYQIKAQLTVSDLGLAAEDFQSHQITELSAQLVSWVQQQLGFEQTETSPVSDVFTSDEFALQSHFRAQHAQATGDSEQALKFLDAALEQDPEFKMAWYEKAVALRRQADTRKALAVLNALQTNDPFLAYRVALVKAQCLDSLGDFSAAEIAYGQALQWARANGRDRQVAAVLISQAILWRKTGQFIAAEQALQQAMAVTDANTQPQLYGTIMNTYAKLAREMHQPELAIDKAQAAIKAFQQSGDLRYQMQAKTVLASILRQRNQWTQAEQLVKESLFHAEQLQHRRGISDNRTKLARLYQQTGRFRLAHDQWQQVLAMNAELELYGNTADAYVWLLRLHFAENNLAQADIDLKMLRQLALEHPRAEIQNLLHEAEFLLALKLADVATASTHLRQLAIIEHELTEVYAGDLAAAQGKHEAAELHFLAALDQLEPTGRLDQMAMVLNRLNALYLVHQPDKLAANLHRTAATQPFIYPLQKYQAMAAAATGKHIEALSLMEELKLKAGDYWQYPDQLLIDQWREAIKLAPVNTD
ncbi:winged helix-turn-helix domain-containing protein [Marinicella meishanensis]|uniref:winged helix-turn-helix domain-containing protein n=1 Tax=Marinicella meishanensis TaxID=2873263 RepID=UPI001CC12168|nr:winged helix-turn-helix domain-containing protein [Marinicella sp. NBU2979]